MADIGGRAQVSGFKIDHLYLDCTRGVLSLPPGGIPVRMFISIFSTIKRRNKASELLRDSKLCHLRMTADQKIKVCFEEPFLIPAEKLYVKKTLGNSATNVIFELAEPEQIVSNIWFETIGHEDSWPLLGPDDDAVQTLVDEDPSPNNATLKCQSHSFLVSQQHSLKIRVELSEKSFPTSLCLTFKVECQTRATREDVKWQSALEPKSHTSILDRSVAFELPERNLTNKRKRDDYEDAETPNISSNKDQGKKVWVIGSDTENSGEDREPSENGDSKFSRRISNRNPENVTTRMRNSRNQNPRYNARNYFQNRFSRITDERPARVSPRKRVLGAIRAAEYRYEEEEEDDEEEETIKRGSRKPLNEHDRPKQSRTQSGKILVPKARRPLYTITDRHMLLPGDELHPSYDEPEDDWLLRREIYAINDFTDVTNEEKELLIKWNTWTLKAGNQCSSGTYFHENLIRFCAENQEWFLEKKCRMKEMCKFWKVAQDRFEEVTFRTWTECLKFLKPESGRWNAVDSAAV